MGRSWLSPSRHKVVAVPSRNDTCGRPNSYPRMSVRRKMSNDPAARLVDSNVETPSGSDEVQPSARTLLPGRRELSPGLVCRVLFGGSIVTFSWVFTAFGMVFVLVFLPTLDLGISSYDQQTTATLTRIEKTNSSENNQPIYRVHYTFRDAAGTEHGGAS